MASVQKKRKHKTLSLLEKNEILKRLEKGETLTSVANVYGVGRATVHDIRKNSDKIKSFCKTNENLKSKRQTLKFGENPKVDESLYAWFLQERDRHTPISGEILKEKARDFYRKITKKDDFQASEGWLHKFKQRYGIRLLSTTGEKLSSDESAVEPYKERFKHVIQEMDLTPDQVYNADESGLFWRLLPKKTFVHREEASAPGRKLAKDRVTFMPCSNASGTHKMTMLVIGKAKNPRAFKNVKLPVDYMNQSKAWMNKSIFTEWFNELFKPSVKRFLKEQKLPQKALLILDNCPGHPDENELNSADNIRVMFLPPNVTPLLQPMDQNVIQAIKMQYKKSLLYNVLSKDESVIKSLKEINLKDVVYSLANAWNNLDKKVIICSWKKLWPDMTLLDQYKKDEPNMKASEEREINLLRDVANEQLVDSPNNALTTNDVGMWLTGEDDENNQFMTEDEIIEEMAREEEDEEQVEGEVTAAVQSISHDAAIASFAASITWAEENGVCANDILVLRRLQEQVLKVSLNSKKQRTIDRYFQPSTSKE